MAERLERGQVRFRRTLEQSERALLIGTCSSFPPEPSVGEATPGSEQPADESRCSPPLSSSRHIESFRLDSAPRFPSTSVRDTVQNYRAPC
jgi:hypothetical protein